MLLAIDVGNTNVTMGVFRDEELVATWRLATDTHKLPDEYALLIRSLLPLKGVAPEDIDSIALCSVVPPLTQVFDELGTTYFGISPLVVGAGIRTGVRILYENPRDVGADRVVDAAAAFTLYGGRGIHHTVISSPHGQVRMSPFANPGLASAGTGDVLAGAVAGLLAQGMSTFDAASCAVYLHGAAGEQARQEMGDTGMVASDLLPRLPLAIKQVKEGR